MIGCWIRVLFAVALSWACTLWLPAPSGALEITEVIGFDEIGVSTGAIASDEQGNVFVGGGDTARLPTPPPVVFVVTPNGRTRKILDESNAGSHGLGFPWALATDVGGTVYVVGDTLVGEQIFKLTPRTACASSSSSCRFKVTEVLWETRESATPLSGARSIATDPMGNVFVAGRFSNNVVGVERPDDCSTTGVPCVVREIADASGDGRTALDFPFDVETDFAGNVFVASRSGIFRISTPDDCGTMEPTACQVTQLVEDPAVTLAIDDAGNLFFPDRSGVVRIDTPQTCGIGTGEPCTVVQVLDRLTSATPPPDTFAGITIDPTGNVFAAGLYVAGSDAYAGLFKVEDAGMCEGRGEPRCQSAEVVGWEELRTGFHKAAWGMTTDPLGDLYLVGYWRTHKVSDIPELKPARIGIWPQTGVGRVPGSVPPAHRGVRRPLRRR